MKLLRICTLFVTLTYLIPLYSNKKELKKIVNLARRLNRGRSKNSSQDQQRLITSATKWHRQLDLDHYHALLPALAEGSTPVITEEYANKFDRSLQMLHTTPGFMPFLARYLRALSLPSIVPEITAELDLALHLQDQNYRIVSMGTYLPDQNGKHKEFDVIAQGPNGQHLLCECKNIAWHRYPITQKLGKKVQKQVLAQQRIANHLNAMQSSRYMLYSKQTFTEQWRAWLTNNEIPFQEGGF